MAEAGSRPAAATAKAKKAPQLALRGCESTFSEGGGDKHCLGLQGMESMIAQELLRCNNFPVDN